MLRTICSTLNSLGIALLPDEVLGFQTVNYVLHSFFVLSSSKQVENNSYRCNLVCNMNATTVRM